MGHVQPGGDRRGGLVLLLAQFRVHMELAPEGDRLLGVLSEQGGQEVVESGAAIRVQGLRGGVRGLAHRELGLCSQVVGVSVSSSLTKQLTTSNRVPPLSIIHRWRS